MLHAYFNVFLQPDFGYDVADLVNGAYLCSRCVFIVDKLVPVFAKSPALFWRVPTVGTADKLLNYFFSSLQTGHKTRPRCSHIAQLNTNVGFSSLYDSEV